MREAPLFPEHVQHTNARAFCTSDLRDIVLPLGLLVLVHLVWSFYAEHAFPRQPMFGERNFVVIFQQAPLFFLASAMAVLLTRLDTRRLALLALATFSIGSFPWFWKFYFITTPWGLVGMFLVPLWLVRGLSRSGEEAPRLLPGWFLVFAAYGVILALFGGLMDQSMLSFKNGISKLAYMLLNAGTALAIIDLVRRGEVTSRNVQSAAFAGALIGLASLAAGFGVLLFGDYPWMTPTGYGLMDFDRIKGFFGGTNAAAPFFYAVFCFGLYLVISENRRYRIAGILLVAIIPIFCVATGSRTLKIMIPLASVIAPLLFRRSVLLAVMAWTILLTVATYESRSLTTAIADIQSEWSSAYRNSLNMQTHDAKKTVAEDSSSTLPVVKKTDGVPATATTTTLSSSLFLLRKSDPNFPEVHEMGKLPGVKGVLSDSRRIQEWRRIADFLAERPWAFLVGAGLGSRADLELEPNNDLLSIVLSFGMLGLALLGYVLSPPFVKLWRDKPGPQRSLWFLIWSGMLVTGLVYSFIMLPLWWALYCIFSIHVQSGWRSPKSPH